MDTLSKETLELFRRALGDAIVKLWSDLPQDIQHRLFEEALRSDCAELRPQLAQFLHDKHTRTLAGAAARAIVEPDSLGG